MKTVLPLVAVLFGVLANPSLCRSQPHPLQFKQARDSAGCIAITTAELNELGDPLFNLVLKDKSNRVRLNEIIDVIQPDTSKRQLFVVDEQIVSSKKMGGRRSVITFLGSNGGEFLVRNVMLSAFFGPNGFSDVVDLEAWGWDNQRLRYNYYKLDTSGQGAGTPGIAAGTSFWKFRASSVGAEDLTIADRQGTCLRCHISGAPVMKELFFPWNNWNAGVGGTFHADYLDKALPSTNRWPAATTAAFNALTGADVLEEEQMLALLTRFAKVRLNAATKIDGTGTPVVSGGKRQIIKGRRLLKSLFETADVNLYSSHKFSGIHPFDATGSFNASVPVPFPQEQFFLNTNLIAGDGEGALGGLQIAIARQFTTFANMTQKENKDLLMAHAVKLLGKVGADTEFALLVPGPAFVDNALINECLQQGAITPHFLAAILAVDLETPVFSDKRKSLLQFVPDEYEYSPVAALNLAAPHNAAVDALTAKVIANIDAAATASGSPADDFRSLLKSANALPELETRVNAYVARVKSKLDAAAGNAANRKAELDRLFQLVLDRRKTMENHPVLRNLDETGGTLLLPLP